MKWGLIWVALLASSGVHAGCGDAAKTMEYRSTPPLLAHDPGSTLVVSVHADGCVSTRIPDFDIRKGEYRLDLPASTLRNFMREVDASGVRTMDMASVRRDVVQAKASRQASDAAVLYHVSDENIIEIELAATGKSAAAVALRTASLRHDLLNMPENAALQRLAAVQGMFEELAAGAHQKGARQ
jgi:hypothetical protein